MTPAQNIELAREIEAKYKAGAESLSTYYDRWRAEGGVDDRFHRCKVKRQAQAKQGGGGGVRPPASMYIYRASEYKPILLFKTSEVER